MTLHETGNHQKEHEIHELGLKLFSDDFNKRDIYWGLLICALSEGDSIESKRYQENYVAAKMRLGESEENIQQILADIHVKANLTDSAIAQYRKLIEQYPHKNYYKNRLAKLLIEEDLDVNEGLEMINKALDKEPDNGYFNETKGWGYFKQGRYEEALALLRRADELDEGFSLIRTEKIRQVEQALASQ